MELNARHQEILAEFNADLPSVLSGGESKRYCNHCGTTFDVVPRFTNNSDITICAEPGCGRIFQHCIPRIPRYNRIVMRVEADG